MKVSDRPDFVVCASDQQFDLCITLDAIKRA
jgi:hypothetical protein